MKEAFEQHVLYSLPTVFCDFKNAGYTLTGARLHGVTISGAEHHAFNPDMFTTRYIVLEYTLMACLNYCI
jgi:hypothetical protein